MKAMCVERRIERIVAYIPFTRVDIGLGLDWIPQLEPEELDETFIKEAWNTSFALDPAIYESLEFSKENDGRLAARFVFLPFGNFVWMLLEVKQIYYYYIVLRVQ